jgi:hypothetical protein
MQWLAMTDHDQELYAACGRGRFANHEEKEHTIELRDKIMSYE